MSRLTHIDDQGRARMVDVSDKAVTTREAVAEGFVAMSPATLELATTGTGFIAALGWSKRLRNSTA